MTNSYPGCRAESGKIDKSQAGLARSIQISAPGLRRVQEAEELMVFKQDPPTKTGTAEERAQRVEKAILGTLFVPLMAKLQGA